MRHTISIGVALTCAALCGAAVAAAQDRPASSGRALVQPDVKERYAALGIEPVSSTPAQLATHIRSESDKYAKLIKDAGIKAE